MNCLDSANSATLRSKGLIIILVASCSHCLLVLVQLFLNVGRGCIRKRKSVNRWWPGSYNLHSKARNKRVMRYAIQTAFAKTILLLVSR